MKDEKKKAMSLAFRLLHAGDKDRSQFVSFLLEEAQLLCRHDFTLHEKFEPIRRFVQFLKPSFEFADKLGR
jgi:hypothetical protein